MARRQQYLLMLNATQGQRLLQPNLAGQTGPVNDRLKVFPMPARQGLFRWHSVTPRGVTRQTPLGRFHLNQTQQFLFTTFQFGQS